MAGAQNTRKGNVDWEKASNTHFSVFTWVEKITWPIFTQMLGVWAQQYKIQINPWMILH